MKMAICKSIFIARSTFSNFFFIFTARKRNLGQGNVFIRVCLFTGGGLPRGGSLPLRGKGSASGRRGRGLPPRG